MKSSPFVTRALTAVEIDARRRALRELLADAIEAGASVGFVLPINDAEIDAYWRSVAADVAARSRQLFVVERGDAMLGTVQLAPCAKSNQPHRADVQKLLVLRSARRQGVGRALMSAVEQTALAAGRWLLTLDTRAGSDAERLYRRLGWVEVGKIPDYASDPDRTLAACTFFYKRLAPGADAWGSEHG